MQQLLSLNTHFFHFFQNKFDSDPKNVYIIVYKQTENKTTDNLEIPRQQTT